MLNNQNVKENSLSKSIEVVNSLLDVFSDCLEHDGFADFNVQVKILKKGQKEIIIQYGRQYRFVIDSEDGSDVINQRYKLVTDEELEKLKKGQAQSFKLAKPAS